MGAEYDFLLRAPKLRCYARSKNRHDKSLNIVMGYILALFQHDICTFIAKHDKSFDNTFCESGVLATVT